MVYGTYNYSIHGVYKPSNITGGPHLASWWQLDEDVVHLQMIYLCKPAHFPTADLGLPEKPAYIPFLVGGLEHEFYFPVCREE